MQKLPRCTKDIDASVLYFGTLPATELKGVQASRISVLAASFCLCRIVE